MKQNSESTRFWNRVASWPATWVCAGLVLATLVAYGDVATLDFVDFDDFEYVVHNPHVASGLSVEDIGWAFTSEYAGYWAPLLWVSYMLDIELLGPGPIGHHVANVALHLANVLLLFGVLWHMTQRLWASGFVALIFAVHPLNVESVAWVTERKNVLSTFFWLLSLGSYSFYVRRASALRYGLTAGFMALGLMVKATLVTLPLLLLLLDYWPLGRIPARGRARPLLSLLSEKVPLLALSAAASVLTYLAQRDVGAMTGAAQLPLSLRAENAVLAYVRYLRKFLWPDDLAVLYPYPSLLGQKMWSPWEVGIAGLFLLLVTGLMLRATRRRPYLFVGWSWYLGVLVPLIGLVQVGVQAIADRHMYVPMVGLLIIVAWGGAELTKGLRHRAWTCLLAAAALTIACVASTRTQVEYWRNSLTLFERAVAVTENNWLALNNVAWLRATCPDAGVRDAERAVVLAERACEITRYQDGQYVDTLAAAYAEAGRFDDAVATSRRAIRLDSAAGRGLLVQTFRTRLAHYERRRPYRSSQGCP